jgi:uncharacterized protein (DUF427 family)
MGLSWQQGPLAPGAIGRFLVPGPLPERLLFAEPLRRRMRVKFGGAWIADSEDLVLLHEPGRYPVAYFPLSDIFPDALRASEYTTTHHDLGPTAWYTVRAGAHSKPRAAWEHTGLPGYAGQLKGRAAFAWRAMDAFYEEDERIVGHAADAYHRIDIRQTSRHLVVQHGDQVVADTTRPLALYESGFAPRWYVPRADLDEAALTPAEGQTFCPYKGVRSYYDIGDAAPSGTHRARRPGQRHPAQVTHGRVGRWLAARRRPETPRLRQLRRLHRPGRQHLGAAGNRLRLILVVGDVLGPLGRAVGDGQVNQERAGRRAVPVPLAGGGGHRVTGPDLLARAAPRLDQARPLGDVQHLAARVLVPRGAGTRREQHAAYFGVRGPADLVPHPRVAGEPAGRCLAGLGYLPGDLHMQQA